MFLFGKMPLFFNKESGKVQEM